MKIFEQLRKAKIALEAAQKKVDELTELAAQIAVQMDKSDRESEGIEYRNGRETWNFKAVPEWCEIEAKISELKHRQSEIEAKEKAFTKLLQQNTGACVVNTQTGEVNEVRAFVEKVGKPTIIFKK